MKIITGLFATFFYFMSFGQTWEMAESLPSTASVRHHPITFSIDGIGYLMGGAMPFTGVLKDFYSYDPDSDTWTALPDFPGDARGFSYGVSNGPKAYIGFGLYENAATFELISFNDLWEFDSETGNWTELSSCPCAERYHPAMLLVNDKIYMGLGANEFGDLGDWWEYDIATDTWTEKTTFPGSVRHHPYYFTIGDDVYVGFGHHTSSIFNDFYRYDPATDTWTTLNNFPEQGRVAGTQFTYNGKGYILSGQGETHMNLPTGEFWEYDPDADEWTALPVHPGGGRWAPGSFVIEDKVYFTCGQADSGEQRDLMVYDFGAAFSGIEDENTEANTDLLYPNPSNGTVVFQTESTTPSSVIINDARGKTAFVGTVNQNEQLDLSSLVPGVYFVMLNNGQSTITEKLVIE